MWFGGDSKAKIQKRRFKNEDLKAVIQKRRFKSGRAKLKTGLATRRRRIGVCAARLRRIGVCPARCAAVGVCPARVRPMSIGGLPAFERFPNDLPVSL